MSDYKNYIVNYDIRADVTKATEAFGAIQKLAQDIQGPMNTLQKAMSSVNQTLNSLRSNSNVKFTPQIDPRAFNSQLKSMVLSVKSAATQMQSAIRGALIGDTTAASNVKKTFKDILDAKNLKELKSLKNDIEKSYDDLVGKKVKNKKGKTTREGGKIHYAKNLPGNEAKVLQLKADADSKLKQLKEIDKAILEREKIEKGLLASQAKGEKAAQKAASSAKPYTASQPAKLTNVTPATIKAWKDAFGDARSRILTLNIRANAEGKKNGALTVIRQVEAGLNGLKRLGNITIKPLIDETAFQTTRAKLNDLVALSNAIAAPFKGQAIKNPAAVTSKEALNGLTADEKKKYLKAESKANKLQNKIASVQSRLDTNRNLLTSQYNPLLQGRITQDEKLLTGYKNQLAVQQQTLGELQQKVTPAVQGATKNIKPLAVDVTGSLTGINTAGKEFVVPVIGNITKVTPPQNVEIPASVKILAEQVNESLRALPRPSLTVNVVLDTKGVAAQLQSIGASITPTKNVTSRPATATPAALSPYIAAPTQTSTAPVAPVQQTFPALTAAEETQMNNLLTGFHKLNKAQESAANNLSKARTKHQEIGSAATLKKLQDAEEKYGTARQAYIDSFNQLKPLMYKQFQSTASRKLTDDEIRQGIGAQNKVEQLLGKKKLTAVQKEELAKAQSTLKELRAPLVTQPAPAPVPAPVPVAKPAIASVATSALKYAPQPVATPPLKNTDVPFVSKTAPTSIPVQATATIKPQQATINVAANITEVRSIKEIVIPIAGELTKVAIKLPSEPVVPVLGNFNVANLQEQIKAVPAIALDLNTTLALEKLEAFIRQIKERSPQNIALTASGAATKPQPAKPATATSAGQTTGTTASKDSLKGKKTTATKPQQTTINAVANVTEVRSVKDVVMPVVGELTKIIIKLPTQPTIKIFGELVTKGIQNQIKAIPRPSLPINMKLTWEKGAIGKQEQLKAIQSKVPPIQLDLDLTKAIAKLEEFISLIKANSPQNITLTASGSGAGGGSNRGKSGSGTGGSTRSAGATSSSGTTLKAPIGKATSHQTDWLVREQNRRAAELATMRNDAMSVFGSGLTPFEQKEADRLFGKASESFEKREKAQRTINAAAHKNRADALRAQAHNAFMPFVGSQSQLNELFKYRRYFRETAKLTGVTPTANMSTAQRLSYLKDVSAWMELNKKAIPFQLQDEINRLQTSIDNGVKATKKAQSAQSIATHQQRANAMVAQMTNGLLPFVKNQSQINDIIKNRKIFSGVAKMHGFVPSTATDAEKLNYLRGVREQMQIQNVKTPLWLQNEIDNLQAANDQQIKAENEKSKRERQGKVNRMRRMRDARIANAALPFVSSQSQLNTVVKNFRYFQKAMDSTGIIPIQGMSQQKMLQYLQGVSQQMQNANVQIPWQLQSTINQLQAQIAKATQAAAQASQAASTASKAATGSKSKVQTVRMENQPKSFYDRTRKWAYPFTGNTSFGARTPMAVEMAKGMGVMFAVGGAMSAIGDSFSKAVEYQNLMRTTNAILKNGTDTYTPSGFSNMERTVRDVGIKTKFSAPEVASAAKFLAMAGYDIESINNAIEPISQLALIGDADLGETADKMTNIMTTFGYDPEYIHKHPDIMRQLGNIMATTATRSNTDLMMLAESAKYGGGVAKLYGGMDKDLFADTMALFGVMGNAGIQASSAGTALRMMYQNIFKPNKNQQKMLDRLKDVHGIRTINDDKSLRSMTDILIDIANKVPQKEMAEVVGSLFRITAQPGAAAALNAAAQADGTDAGEVGKGFNAIADFTEKKGLGALVSLMEANRASVNGNILGSVAEEKQNTIKGLWAQVTSTFTEGILQAFEKNEGYFVKKLSELRDYLAKPETIEVIQKLVDMVISIGKVMAKFVKIWVDFYQKFEPIVKAWIVTQMFFTQVGLLITPLISVISVFDRLRSSLMAFAGISAATSVAGASNAWTAVASAARASKSANIAHTAGVMLAYNTKDALFKRNLHNQLVMHGMMLPLTGKWDREGWREKGRAAMIADRVKNHPNSTLATLMHKKRAKQMANPELMSRLSRMKMHQSGKFWSGVGTAVRAGITTMSFTNLFGSLASVKAMLIGLASGLAKVLGMLVSPFTLVAAAAGTLGYAIFKLGQYTSSATDAQIKAYRDLKDELGKSAANAKERHSGTDKLLEQNGLGTSRVEGYKEDPEYGKPEVSEFAKNYQYLFNNEIVSRSGASRKANKSIAESMKAMYSKDATMKLALGDEYDKLLGNGLEISSEKYEERMLNPQATKYSGAGDRATSAMASQLFNWIFGEKKAATELIDNATILAIKAEGAKNPKVLQAREQILDLYKEIGYTDEFVTKAKNIAKGAANIDDPNLVGDEYITKEKLQNQAFDISRLKSYVQAGYNVLIGEAEGKEGSLIGFLKAQSEIKKELTPYSEDWWKQVSQIANNYKLIQDIEFGGKAYKDIEILVKMSSNGELDYANILKQVQEHIAGFNGNLQWYFQFVDQIYGLLAGAGKIPNTPESRRNFLLKAAGGRKLSEQEVEDYHVSTEDELYGSPAPLAPKKDDDDLKSWFQRQNESFENAVGKYLEAKDKVLKTSPTPNTDGKDGKDGTGNPDPTKQNDYDSKYDRSAAKPTQIIFNIDKLANFDRTTVAASSEERDLMNAIESKMAEVVYRIVAEAMNTANNIRS